jgi:acetyl-CoA C-acetyltransferase
MTEEIILAGSVRTAIGKFGGALADIPAHKLGAAVITESLKRSNVSPADVDEVLIGCVIQAGLGQNVARQAALAAGLPESVPATTINKVCGSSMKCVNLAAALIRSGEAKVVIAGGMENMSAAPYILDRARFGYRMNNGVLRDAMVFDALWDAINNVHMGITAENIASKYGISRRRQDEFAALSQQKCEAAQKQKLFFDEIIPMEIKTKGGLQLFDADEYPRDGVSAENIAGLNPVFLPGGTVTAANASGINDGAAAVILMSGEYAESHGIKGEARYLNGASAGVSPALMGLGAAAAAQKVLAKTGRKIVDMTLIEANEAFAAQSIACGMEGGWDPFGDRINVNGGAIALGHPVGASGCRILTTLIHELNRRGGGLGLATLCIGGGMGAAAIIEI